MDTLSTFKGETEIQNLKSQIPNVSRELSQAKKHYINASMSILTKDPFEGYREIQKLTEMQQECQVSLDEYRRISKKLVSFIDLSPHSKVSLDQKLENEIKELGKRYKKLQVSKTKSTSMKNKEKLGHRIKVIENKGPVPVTEAPVIVPATVKAPVPVTVPTTVTVPASVSVPSPVKAPTTVTVPAPVTVPTTVKAPVPVTVPASVTVPAPVTAPTTVKAPVPVTVPTTVTVPAHVQDSSKFDIDSVFSLPPIADYEKLNRLTCLVGEIKSTKSNFKSTRNIDCLESTKNIYDRIVNLFLRCRPQRLKRLGLYIQTSQLPEQLTLDQYRKLVVPLMFENLRRQIVGNITDIGATVDTIEGLLDFKKIKSVASKAVSLTATKDGIAYILDDHLDAPHTTQFKNSLSTTSKKTDLQVFKVVNLISFKKELDDRKKQTIDINGSALINGMFLFIKNPKRLITLTTKSFEQELEELFSLSNIGDYQDDNSDDDDNDERDVSNSSSDYYYSKDVHGFINEGSNNISFYDSLKGYNPDGAKKRNLQFRSYLSQLVLKQKANSFTQPLPGDIVHIQKINDLLSTQYDFKKCSDQTLWAKKTSQSELFSLLKTNFPKDNFESYGSFVNGIQLESSDIDVCFKTDFNTSDPVGRKDLMKRIALCLNKKKVKGKPKYHVERILDSIKVPIIKFRDLKHKVSYDMCFNNRLAIGNSLLVKAYSEIDERAKQLMLLIKYWASRKYINDASEGTLSSYGWLNMVIFYLQTVQPPVLPSLHSNIDSFPDDQLQQKDDWKFIDPRHTGFISQNKMTLFQLFYGFFNFYSKFDYANQLICIRLGKPTNITLATQSYKDNNKECPISIQDPFDSSSNPGASVKDTSSFGIIIFEFMSMQLNLFKLSYKNDIIQDFDGLLFAKSKLKLNELYNKMKR
ncbi:hypothetical protein DFA_09264 [Cavenderia fasciculata]|uniref:PAP-associated domain-containing protein n=1 Tax=Cavenderia fasciculata TaxID=261658 RepID=F4Q752_CACFS|nr:uncharacterized protein DFA_09264 [Cavenderia fasciculata]EGG16234.1 hypothetical protein DFA_09264 [Cavenderia fasciculata]|eukprot:XP_004354618.1 hypothetical protein DFA_09264 [Cavenderia fasciculata]